MRHFKINWDSMAIMTQNGADYQTRQFFARHEIDSTDEVISVDASLADDLERVLEDSCVASYAEIVQGPFNYVDEEDFPTLGDFAESDHVDNYYQTVYRRERREYTKVPDGDGGYLMVRIDPNTAHVIESF